MKVKHSIPDFQEPQDQVSSHEASLTNPAMQPQAPQQFHNAAQQGPYKDLDMDPPKYTHSQASSCTLPDQGSHDHRTDESFYSGFQQTRESEQFSRGSERLEKGPLVWRVKGLDLKLNALEATVAVKMGVWGYEELDL